MAFTVWLVRAVCLCKLWLCLIEKHFVPEMHLFHCVPANTSSAPAITNIDKIVSTCEILCLLHLFLVPKDSKSQRSHKVNSSLTFHFLNQLWNTEFILRQINHITGLHMGKFCRVFIQSCHSPAH